MDPVQQLEQENARCREVIRRLEARDAITRIILESASLDQAAPPMLRAICELLGWDVALLWTPDPQSGALRCAHAWTARPSSALIDVARQRAFPMGVGLPGRVWMDGGPAWIRRVDRDDNFTRTAQAAADGLISAFAFPLAGSDELTAVIEVFSSQEREPDPSLTDTFTITGRQIALIAHRRNSALQLERRSRIAQLRLDVATALAGSAPVPEVLTACTSALVTQLGVAFARVWTLNAAENVLELRASSGLYTHIDGAHARVPVGAFKIGWIAEKRQPHVTNSVPEDPRVTDRAWAVRERMQAFAGYPLLSEGRLLGVLAMFSRTAFEPLTFDELAPVADAVAQFLDRRRAEAELRRSQAIQSGILHTAFDAIIAINHLGRIIEFNPAAESMFERDRSAVLGQNIADVIIPPRFREAHRAGFTRYLSTGEAHVIGKRIQVYGMRAGGSEFPVELAIARIPGEDPPLFTAYLRSL